MITQNDFKLLLVIYATKESLLNDDIKQKKWKHLITER